MNKIHVIDKILHENNQEILVDYGGEFELIGKLSVGDEIRHTHIRVRKITDYESYINAIDEGYDAEYVILLSKDGDIYSL